MKYSKRILVISFMVLISMTIAYANDKKACSNADKKCCEIKACKDVNDINVPDCNAAKTKCSEGCKKQCCAGKECCINDKKCSDANAPACCKGKCCMKGKKCPSDPNATKNCSIKDKKCKMACPKMQAKCVVADVNEPNDPNKPKCLSKICKAAAARAECKKNAETSSN